MPTRKTGKVVAVCISAIKMGEWVNFIINQTPPTFWNQVPALAASEANQIARNVAMRSGAHQDGVRDCLVAIAVLHKH